MTKDTLFEILGEIDGDMINESESNLKKPSEPWLKFVSIAACVIIVTICTIPIISITINKQVNNKENDSEVSDNLNNRYENYNSVIDKYNYAVTEEKGCSTDEGGNAGLKRTYSIYENINDKWYACEVHWTPPKTAYLTLARNGIEYETQGWQIVICPCIDNAYIDTITGDDPDAVYNLPNIPLPICKQPDYKVIDTITVGNIDFDMFYHNDDIWCHYTYEDNDYHIETKNVSKKEIIDLINILFGHHANSDVPADTYGSYAEAVNLDVLSDVSLSAFCGSYLDENGDYIILITEDTEEIRNALLADTGRTADNTVFKTAKYTRQYLTELQARISDAMSNHDIPFVISSGIYDDKNRIIVTVNTEDETEYSKVYAFDTIGGAIEIEYGDEVFALTDELSTSVSADILPDKAIPKSE